ncbi:MAG: hypothetical protein CMM04_17005 [Rhodopirellula sp.]|nr:hypothetical protein [Rhodopirellula sp.]|tara:strand:- start:344 stop:667 length:324 start_codon:yes stop_codon:yes gene_type:complete
MEDNKSYKYEVGEICSMQFGAGFGRVKFYQVTRRTEKNVWFERLDESFEHDGYGQVGFKTPLPNSPKRSKEFRRKINNDGGEEFACMPYEGVIQKWNGKPIYYNSMD